MEVALGFGVCQGWGAGWELFFGILQSLGSLRRIEQIWFGVGQDTLSDRLCFNFLGRPRGFNEDINPNR